MSESVIRIPDSFVSITKRLTNRAKTWITGAAVVFVVLFGVGLVVQGVVNVTAHGTDTCTVTSVAPGSVTGGSRQVQGTVVQSSCGSFFVPAGKHASFTDGGRYVIDWAGNRNDSQNQFPRITGYHAAR